MNVLTDVDLFQDFPPEGLERLLAEGRPRTFQTGEPLLRQGEVSDVMYVIVRGRVRRERAHVALSEPAAVLEVGPGESVGELGVLDAGPWPETVTAIDETDALELSALLLAETMLRYPVPSVGLLTSLSRSINTLADLETHAHRLRSRLDQSTPGA
jgi:CRP/FNR family transcriptional regulator, anaerobic regulatory protein